MKSRFFSKKGIYRGGLIILAAVAAITAYNLGSTAEVRLEMVRKGNIREMIELQGRVELDDSEKVYSELEGLIDKTYAAEGDEVEAGARLLQLSVEDMDFAIGKAEAAYNAAEAQLGSLKKSIKPEHISLAGAELEQARAAGTAVLYDYRNKQDNYEKIKLLYGSGAASEKEMKDTETLLAESEGSFRRAEQAVKMAEYNLAIIKSGVSEDDIKAAEANARHAKIQLEELLFNRGKTNVYSPIGGIVLSKEVDENQSVLPGATMYEIGDYDSAYIKVEVLVEDIAKIYIGQKGIISGEVLRDEEIQGEVYYIAPKAVGKVSSLGIEQQRIEVRIKFDNTGLKLRPGYTIDVDIVSEEKSDTLYVPDKAVFEMNGRDTVFVVRNRRLEPCIIETGIENDDAVEVISGVTEGETVVVDPDSNLKPGQKVKSKNNS